MRRNVLILEDKKSHRENICRIISGLNLDIKVYAAADIRNAYQISMENHIHLFVVDIILCPENPGDVQGLEFAQEIREVKKYQFTPLIFITSLEDPQLYSYSELQCFNYIEKPFDTDQVKKMVLKALQFPIVDDAERPLYFRKDGIVYAKNKKDIIYIENMRRKIVIHCVNDVLEIPYKTCDQIIKEADTDLFIRCSRYTIVNRNFIEHIDYANRYVKLRGIDKQIEIGITMKNRFKDKLV